MVDSADERPLFDDPVVQRLVAVRRGSRMAALVWCERQLWVVLGRWMEEI